MGEVEIAGTDALDGRPADLAQRRLEAQGRADPVLRPDDAAKARSSTTCWSTAWPTTLPAGRERRRTSTKDFAWIDEQVAGAVPTSRSVNSSSRYALIAIQGPQAREILADAHRRRPVGHQVLLVRARRGRRRPRHDLAHRLHRRGRLRGLRAAAAGATACGMALLEAGKPVGVVPAGLGARDTLRLEAAMRLYGNDIDDDDHRARGRPRLDRRLEQGRRSSARDVLHAQKASGVATQARRLRDDRPRHRAATATRCFVDGEQVGHVTSGTQTPFLKKAIGMAYVPLGARGAGHRDRDRHPRPPGQGGGRAAAVLQARPKS